MTAAIFSAAFVTSQYFQFARHYSPLGTGLAFLPWTATPLVIAPIAGALSDRVGARALAVPGLAMQAAGFAWIVSLAGGPAGYRSYILPFVMAGAGISMALPCVTASGLNAVPPAMLGKAAGILNTMQQFGSVFGIAVVTAVFTAEGSLAGPAAPLALDPGHPHGTERIRTCRHFSISGRPTGWRPARVTATR